MDIRKIEYFIKVAETLNFSKAASQMPISHQALSKQIQLLEEDLGIKLFERSTSKVVLTEAGAKAYSIFKPLMRDLEQGYAELLEFIKNKKRTLRVGYFNGLSYGRVIAPYIRTLEQQFPQLRIDTLATDLGLIKQLLEQDSIDLVIFPVFDEYEWKNKDCFPIVRSPARIIVSDNHPWFQREAVFEEDLSSASLLVYENRPLAGENSLLPDLKVGKRVPAYNYDTYMGILRRGEAFGIIGDTYSRREGAYKLFDLPKPYAFESIVVAAYKPFHPLNTLLHSLDKEYWDNN